MANFINNFHSTVQIKKILIKGPLQILHVITNVQPWYVQIFNQICTVIKRLFRETSPSSRKHFTQTFEFQNI